MKQKKKRNLQETGITLIALVVTIIILLILAGVTVSLVVGQNGLLQRAQTASNTIANATANEITQMGKYANEVDELTSGFIAGGGSQQGGAGGGSGSGGSGSITITQGGTPVDLATIGSLYGSDVTYNGRTYQLFYVDTTGKYSGGTAGTWLQLKTPVSTEYTPGENYNTDLISTANSVLWQVNPHLESQYGSTLRGLTTDTLNGDNYINLRGAAGLCNTTYWNTYGLTGDDTYISPTDTGAYVIGGVSAEMYCDSYNAYKGRTSTDEAYYDAKAFYNEDNSAYGYLYKPKNSDSSVVVGNYGDYTNYSYATQETEASGMYRYNDWTSTWLASPSAFDPGSVCYVYVEIGDLSSSIVDIATSVRPAVFLPSSIQISLGE